MNSIVYDKKLDIIMSKSGEVMFTRTNTNDNIIHNIILMTMFCYHYSYSIVLTVYNSIGIMFV